MSDNLLTAGRTAVITGAASGIGAAAATSLAQKGMQLFLFDRDRTALTRLAARLDTPCICVTGDVTREEDLRRLRDAVLHNGGDVALLFNSAGIKAGGGPWDPAARWRAQFETNLFSMVAVQQLFVPLMLAMPGKGAIVNLGSKEGITTPPGNAAYNAAKAAVKVLTEQLAHELRTLAGDKVSAHLLVPGFTWTEMNFPGMDPERDAVPAEAWTAQQVITYFLARFQRGDFYIICPDNAVTTEMDNKRIAWASDDIIHNRPALSRWHPAMKAAFDNWMKK